MASTSFYNEFDCQPPDCTATQALMSTAYRTRTRSLKFIYSHVPYIPSGIYLTETEYDSYRVRLVNPYGPEQYKAHREEIEIFDATECNFGDYIEIHGLGGYRYRVAKYELCQYSTSPRWAENIYRELTRYSPYSNHNLPLRHTGLADTCATNQLTEKETKPMCESEDSDVPVTLSITERVTASANDKLLIRAGYKAKGQYTQKAKDLATILFLETQTEKLVAMATEELDEAKE